MALYILRPKLINSWDFFKNFEKVAVQLFKKQVISFFTVVFCPMIHNIYLKRYCLLTSLLFLFFLLFSFNFCFKFKGEILL